MSLYENDRRTTPRHRPQLAIRVLVLVTRRTPDEAESVLTCNGYTHDISETGLALIISAKSITETFLDGENCTMHLVLTLPSGSVEIKAVPVRYDRLATPNPDTDGGEAGVVHTDQGFLVGMIITEMRDEARARYVAYIQELLQS